MHGRETLPLQIPRTTERGNVNSPRLSQIVYVNPSEPECVRKTRGEMVKILLGLKSLMVPRPTWTLMVK